MTRHLNRCRPCGCPLPPGHLVCAECAALTPSNDGLGPEMIARFEHIEERVEFLERLLAKRQENK